MNYPMLRYLFGMILLIEAAFLALPLGVAAVSYTHLDVYKRQSYYQVVKQ